MRKRKPKRNRPPAARLTMPQPITDATPEEVMRALVNSPPKKRDEWEYLKQK